MAYLGLADDGLQVRCGLQIVGVRAAHERFDGRLADGPAEEQLDHGGFRHGSDAGQYVDEFVVPRVRPGQVHVVHVPPERLFAFHRQPVQNGLRVFGTSAPAAFDWFCQRCIFPFNIIRMITVDYTLHVAVVRSWSIDGVWGGIWGINGIFFVVLSNW